MIVGAAPQQGHGVGLPLLRVHIPHHLPVAGHFHVPAQENVGQPHQWIEPMNAKGDEAQQFVPVVKTADMGLLMGDDQLPFFRCQLGRQIDLGL